MLDSSSAQRFFVCEVEPSLSRIQRLQINSYRKRSRKVSRDVVWRAPGPMAVDALVKGLLDDAHSLSKVITFVQAKIDQDSRSARLCCRATILQYVICCRQIQSAFDILRAGASPNVGIDTDLPTPLQLALELREVSLARELLARGASPSLKSNHYGNIFSKHSLWLRLGPRGSVEPGNGPSPPGLLRAAELGSTDLVDDFVRYGADINEPLPDGSESSVLTAALKAADLPMARHLVALGASMTMPASLSYDSRILRRTSAAFGRTEIAVDKNDGDERRLHINSISGLIALVKAGALETDLQGSSDDANAIELDSRGLLLTPLTTAMGALSSKHHSHKLAHRLIHLGADVSTTSALPSPIETALTSKCFDCLAMLCDHGLRLNKPRIFEVAAATGSTAIFKRLIELSVITGAPVRSGDGTNSMRHDLARASLQGALVSNNLKNFKDLCKTFVSGYLGVQIDLRAPCFVTVMERACKHSSQIRDVAEKLSFLMMLDVPHRDGSAASHFTCCAMPRYTAQTEHELGLREPQKSCLHRAIKSNCLDLVSLFLNPWVKHRPLYRDGQKLVVDIFEEVQTALVYACRLGNVALIQMLIAGGAKPEPAGFYDMSPIQAAAQYGQLAAVRCLVDEYKVDPDNMCPENTGFTALQLAAANGHASIVLELVRAGADINCRKSSGFTALELAVKYGHSAVASQLSTAGADLDQLESERITLNNRAALTAKSEKLPLAELLQNADTKTQEAVKQVEVLEDANLTLDADVVRGSQTSIKVPRSGNEADFVLAGTEQSSLLDEALLATVRALRID